VTEFSDPQVCATRSFFRRRIVDPVFAALRQGVTPEKLALSIAFGIVLGMCPILGAPTFLCIAATLLFRLNPAAIQVANYLVYPLQIVLIIPFIRLGEWMFGRTPLVLSSTQILALFKESFFDALATLWMALLCGTAAWIVTGAASVAVLYLVLTPVMRKVAATILLRRQAAVPPPSAPL
jgi:uncharacterized protein (DUF2062 family)